MWQTVSAMPPGVLVFMGYAFLVLSVLGLFMPLRDRPGRRSRPSRSSASSWMLLLAYLIFTMTLVLQKKQAAYRLSLGLTSLLLPLAPSCSFAPAGWILRSRARRSSCSWSGRCGGRAAAPGSASRSG